MKIKLKDKNFSTPFKVLIIQGLYAIIKINNSFKIGKGEYY